MKHLDLFSGIGGFAYAAQQVWGADYENIGFCDNDWFCQQVLTKNFPGATIYGDVQEIKHKQSADLVTGGFPCQPFSSAGLRRGTADDRYLWPEMLRVIRLTKPAWVIAENVRGLVTWDGGMVFEQVCVDLEAAGYEVQPLIIPAAAVNAPHRRDRIWFVANASGERLQRSSCEATQGQRALSSQSTGISEKWAGGWTVPEPRTIGVDDGVPNRVDRIAALGNAIVPQVAIEIMKAIKDINQ